jgi:hypothetical protein
MLRVESPGNVHPLRNLQDLVLRYDMTFLYRHIEGSQLATFLSTFTGYRNLKTLTLAVRVFEGHEENRPSPVSVSPMPRFLLIP